MSEQADYVCGMILALSGQATQHKAHNGVVYGRMD